MQTRLKANQSDLSILQRNVGNLENTKFDKKKAEKKSEPPARVQQASEPEKKEKPKSEKKSYYS